MSTPLLRIENVTKAFGAVQALRGVSFDLRAGEVHALVGENGAGKSTLIRIITGAHQPDSGSIYLDGEKVTELNPKRARAHGIAVIYQQPALFPDLSVAENIALGLEQPAYARRVHWREREAQAKNLLKRLGSDLDPWIEARQLSMPEQQIVDIARALGAAARILILDEPTASLAGGEVELLLQLIRDLRAEGTGIIYISHRLPEVLQIADRVTVLRDGTSMGTREGSGETWDESGLIQLMVGRQLSDERAPVKAAAGDVVLKLQNLGCAQTGLHAIDLEIRAGEILGLAGLVGAGRTELGRALFGITPADEGTLRLCGKPLKIDSPGEAIRAGIAYVPEDRRRHGVILEMSVAANMTMSIHGEIFPRGWLRFEAERELARKYIGDLMIKAPGPETETWKLSGGNQQKVALGRWLAARPQLLILDEPTQGVDVGAKAEIHKLIRRLAAQGMAVLLISSELPEVLVMSHRIAVMRNRTIVKVFDRTEADAQVVMAAALGAEKSE